jgi:phospholipid/cholesterol/gamma-HCH transport system substrate-binding protein
MAHRGFDWRRLRVGALVIVGLSLFAYGLYRVGKIFDVFASRYTLVTMVNDVAGLREGAPVTLAGQRIGQVDKIDFIPVERKHDDSNLVVTLEVSERVKDQIRKNSRIFLRAQGLLGDKYVDITPGTKGYAVLAELDTIPSESAMDIEQFLARSGALLDTASLAIADVRKITGGLARGEGTIGRMLTSDQLFDRVVAVTGDLQMTLRGFNDPNGTMGRLLHDPALANRMIAAVTKIDSLGTSILRGQGSLGKLFTSDALHTSLMGTAMKADSAMGGINSFLGGLTTGNGALQKLAQDPRMYDEMLKAIVDLQTILAEMRANPKKYVPPVNVKVF